MATIKLFPVFTIIFSLIFTGLVTGNPLPPTSIDTKFLTGLAGLVVRQSDHSAYGEEATCDDIDDCCILDFTRVSCADHAKPACTNSGCNPVPPPIAFSYAGLPDEYCINVLDQNGDNTIYDQFFISHCTGYIDSIELYSKNNCGGSSWNQVNTAGCYYNGGGIGSFKIISSDRKRALEALLLNGSDSQSISTYPFHENIASVTPQEDCFDKENGAYILGCNVERSGEIGESIETDGWNSVKEDWEPEWLVGRSELPPPECMNPITGKYIIGCNYAEQFQIPKDEDTYGPPSDTALEDPSHRPSHTIAVRTPYPTICKNLYWCIVVDLGFDICDGGSAVETISDEGNYQCVDLPSNFSPTQVKPTFIEGQIEGHDGLYAQATFFDGNGCTGNSFSTNAEPVCWYAEDFAIRSYRIWIEGACGDTIGPCGEVDNNPKDPAITIATKRSVSNRTVYGKGALPTVLLDAPGTDYTKTRQNHSESSVGPTSRRETHKEADTSTRHVSPYETWYGIAPAHITVSRRSGVTTKKTATPDGATASVTFRNIKAMDQVDATDKVTTQILVLPGGIATVTYTPKAGTVVVPGGIASVSNKRAVFTSISPPDGLHSHTFKRPIRPNFSPPSVSHVWPTASVSTKVRAESEDVPSVTIEV